MKKSSIQIGNQYEVKAGRNVTVVTVKAVNEATGGWICETSKGRTMNVANAERFVKQVGAKEGKPKAETDVPTKEKTSGKKPSLREIIESKGITIIPKGRRATKSMQEFDDPTLTRKHHVTKKGVLVLEAEDKPKHLGPKPLGTMSALAAAHRVLKEAGRPMRIREIVETALANNYCTLNGKTPHCTINGGIQKEIKTKGDKSRFEWVGKGLFAAR